jgi:predicted transposase YdaD
LHAVDCDELLRQDTPDAWVLAILCDFKERLLREVAHTILSRLQQRFADNPPRFREYVEMLNILADNRDLNLDIYEEITMLQVNIERTAIYRIGMEKGIEQGMEEGAHRQALDIARRMLASGVEVAAISAFTGLPLNDVESLDTSPLQGDG